MNNLKHPPLAKKSLRVCSKFHRAIFSTVLQLKSNIWMMIPSTGRSNLVARKKRLLPRFKGLQPKRKTDGQDKVAILSFKYNIQICSHCWCRPLWPRTEDGGKMQIMTDAVWRQDACWYYLDPRTDQYVYIMCTTVHSAIGTHVHMVLPAELWPTPGVREAHIRFDKTIS